MANYAALKRVTGDGFVDNSLCQAQTPFGSKFGGVQWIYNERGLTCGQCANAGGCVEQANGKCCEWTVPTQITRVTFELWSGGGAGAGLPAGSSCASAGQTSIGGAGGNYAIKAIDTAPGCKYTVCAGGSFPCNAVALCQGGQGCASYVTGNNLSNFCVNGGCGGWWCASDPYGPYYYQSCMNCGICGWFGADYGVMGTTGMRFGSSGCTCWGHTLFTGAAPFIGIRQHLMMTESDWGNAGCYINWPAGGGLSGGSTLCNTNVANCNSLGTMGGSGIVKITYA